MTPKLPNLRKLTAELKDIHEAWSHPDCEGEYVCLWCADHDLGCWGNDYRWRLDPPDFQGLVIAGPIGREYIPGSREIDCSCRNGWRISSNESNGPESCRACGGTGRIHVPTPFDATAAARRLLAAAREAGHR